MDKRKLKNYLKHTHCELEKNCYLMFSEYVVSNKYSIVCLNNSNDLNIITSKDNNLYYKQIKDFRAEFRYNTHFYKDLEVDFKTDFYNIDKDYSISIKNLKEVKNLIKADKFTILTTDNYFSKYVIKIENSKTYEVGYLLPCKNY